MTREFDLEENRHVFLIRPSLLRIVVSLLLELGENPIQATEMQGVFCLNVKALSLQLGQITLQFPKLQGETGWLQTASTATQSRVFRLSPDTPQSVGKKPGIAPPNGGRSLLLETGERVSAEERRLAPGLSLLGIFGGHSSTDFGALENDAGGAGSNCHRRITTAIQPTTSARGNHEVRRLYSGCTARVHRVQDFEEVADSSGYLRSSPPAPSITAPRG